MNEINARLLKYVPTSKQEAIRSIYKDDDGYWAHIGNGYHVADYFAEHTIHEDTLPEFRKIFKCISKD